MSVLIMKKSNLPEVKKKIGEGATSISFITKDNLVLKRYCKTEVYQRLIEYHQYQFLEYLVELSKLDSSVIVKPQDIFYIQNKIVAAQTHEYLDGETLFDLHPNINLDNLFKALESFYQRIDELNYLKLKDTHYKNIIYTGNIHLLDLDFCKFTDKNVKRENLAHINEFVIKGLFKIPSDTKIIVDKTLTDVLESVLNGEVDALEFLYMYRDLIIQKYGRCDRIKYLGKDFLR